MVDTQYSLFRDLDRHCVTGGMREPDCVAAVRQKRASIESELIRRNPVAGEVLAGRTTFVEIYNSYSRSLRGFRRFVPLPHDPAQNDRLAHFAQIIPNVQHFTRRSILAADNPVMCAAYGVIAACAVATIWAQALRDDADAVEATAALDERMWFLLMLIFGCTGFVLGLFAMLRYRTRDRRRIHAREAAAYMDMNYQCHRTLDDEGWARLIAQKTASGSTAGSSSAVPPLDAGSKATAR